MGAVVGYTQIGSMYPRNTNGNLYRFQAIGVFFPSRNHFGNIAADPELMGLVGLAYQKDSFLPLHYT
jgi:hypothetical protein